MTYIHALFYNHSWQWWVYFIFAIALFVFVVGALIKIWLEERSKVSRIPKIPFKICDIHGPYPESASLWISVPEEGKPDLRVEICPYCVYERQQEMLKKMKA
jgi:hypothetical protein